MSDVQEIALVIPYPTFEAEALRLGPGRAKVGGGGIHIGRLPYAPGAERLDEKTRRPQRPPAPPPLQLRLGEALIEEALDSLALADDAMTPGTVYPPRELGTMQRLPNRQASTSWSSHRRGAAGTMLSYALICISALIAFFCQRSLNASSIEERG